MARSTLGSCAGTGSEPGSTSHYCSCDISPGCSPLFPSLVPGVGPTGQVWPPPGEGLETSPALEGLGCKGRRPQYDPLRGSAGSGVLSGPGQ